eukprot:990080-Pyramimonas_sp.AAC.1
MCTWGEAELRPYVVHARGRLHDGNPVVLHARHLVVSQRGVVAHGCLRRRTRATPVDSGLKVLRLCR